MKEKKGNRMGDVGAAGVSADADIEREGIESEGEEKRADGASMPVGMRRINPIDGERNFVEKKRGAIVHGVLLGRFQSRRKDTRGNPQFYYQIQVFAPCEVTRGKKDTESFQRVIADVGDIVTLDEADGLRPLADFVPGPPTAAVPTGRHVVWVHARDKIRTNSGNTFWQWDLGAESEKPSE